MSMATIMASDATSGGEAASRTHIGDEHMLLQASPFSRNFDSHSDGLHIVATSELGTGKSASLYALCRVLYTEQNRLPHLMNVCVLDVGRPRFLFGLVGSWHFGVFQRSLQAGASAFSSPIC